MRPIRSFAVLVLAGCSTLGRPGARPLASGGVAFVQQRSDWASAARIRPDSGAQRAAALERYRAEHGVPLTFWPADSMAPRARRRLVIDDHPCGKSVTAFVKRMPMGDPVLVGELAVELDSAGRATTTWQIPVDVVARGVRGDALLIAAPMPGLTLAIKPNGTFRVVANEDAAKPVRVDCPRLPAFGRSDYLVCLEFADDGRMRRIAYQRPCT